MNRGIIMDKKKIIILISVPSIIFLLLFVVFRLIIYTKDSTKEKFIINSNYNVILERNKKYDIELFPDYSSINDFGQSYFSYKKIDKSGLIKPSYSIGNLLLIRNLSDSKYDELKEQTYNTNKFLNKLEYSRDIYSLNIKYIDLDGLNIRGFNIKIKEYEKNHISMFGFDDEKKQLLYLYCYHVNNYCFSYFEDASAEEKGELFMLLNYYSNKCFMWPKEEE